MKPVLKCDFCHQLADIDAVDVMSTHEAECAFNPTNKTCYTCRFQECGWEFNTECVKHNYDFYFEVGEGDRECPDWEEK